MKDKFVLSFVAFTEGERRRDKETGWRLCTFEKELSSQEAARAALTLESGMEVHIVDVDFVYLEPFQIGSAIAYVFEPADATRAINVPLRSRRESRPVLPQGKSDFATLKKGLKRLGYKLTIGRVIDAKPLPYRRPNR